MGCKPARLLAALSSEDFGTQTVTTTALKNMPDEGLAASMGITVEELADIRSGFQPNPAQAAQNVRVTAVLDASLKQQQVHVICRGHVL
eukprot:11719-Heterococcus_DN1.PRE.5